MSSIGIIASVAAAVVWHWWVAPLLVAGGVLALAATVVGYLTQVVRPRFPPKGYVAPDQLADATALAEAAESGQLPAGDAPDQLPAAAETAGAAEATS